MKRFDHHYWYRVHYLISVAYLCLIRRNAVNWIIFKGNESVHQIINYCFRPNIAKLSLQYTRNFIFNHRLYIFQVCFTKHKKYRKFINPLSTKSYQMCTVKYPREVNPWWKNPNSIPYQQLLTKVKFNQLFLSRKTKLSAR